MILTVMSPPAFLAAGLALPPPLPQAVRDRARAVAATTARVDLLASDIAGLLLGVGEGTAVGVWSDECGVGAGPGGTPAQHALLEPGHQPFREQGEDGD